jgi:hypothetical protein
MDAQPIAEILLQNKHVSIFAAELAIENPKDHRHKEQQTIRNNLFKLAFRFILIIYIPKNK